MINGVWYYVLDKNWILNEYNTKSIIDRLELSNIQSIELKEKKAPF